MNIFFKFIVFSVLLASALMLKLMHLNSIFKLLPKKQLGIFSPDRESLVKTVQSLSTKLSFLDNCLVRAICFYFLASVSNLSASIYFGVRKDENLEAHAWVEDAKQNIILGKTPDFNSYTLIGEGISNFNKLEVRRAA